MHCPFCRHPDSRVVDSRTADDGAAIRRRRQCPHCSRRFTTVENASLTVIKRSGVTEPFSRDKVIAGVRKACQGRPVTEDALAQLGQRVEEAVRATGSAELSTHDVGLAILGPLRDLDLVAYLRFASVYKAFESLEDFEAAIAELRESRAAGAGGGEAPVAAEEAAGAAVDSGAEAGCGDAAGPLRGGQAGRGRGGTAEGPAVSGARKGTGGVTAPFAVD
ncbi:transcriptional repressor NrdR [Streptomyces sp. NHF165]|uniref:transcriptional regulator NrdR n=1 Tax=Streptomyces sp. NHF165 TaxID=2175864 RepID=UPI00132F158B|nr:transcriptional regulator NrdR [Streptomyces sp. NHF165]QHF96616.1 transcriptional repressor NrdR [Streptomyces sp. NHF165]